MYRQLAQQICFKEPVISSMHQIKVLILLTLMIKILATLTLEVPSIL